MLAPGGLAFTALERWFELGRYQPLVAGVGVILSAILNPDGVTAQPPEAPDPPRHPARSATDLRVERAAVARPRPSLEVRR